MENQTCAVLFINAISLNHTNLYDFIKQYSWHLENTAFILTNIPSESIRKQVAIYLLNENPELEILPILPNFPVMEGNVFLALMHEEVLLKNNRLWCDNDLIYESENLNERLFLPEIQDYIGFVKSIFDTEHIGIFLTNEAGLILKSNQGFFRILGFREDELLAASFMQYILVPTEKELQNRFDNFINSSEENYHAEWDFKDKEGKIQNVLTDITKIKTQKNTILCLFFVRDITSIKKQQRLLTETEQNAQVGGWELDLLTGELSWTKEIYRIYELSEDEKINLYKGLKYYDFDSLNKLKIALTKGIQEGQAYDLELKMKTQKGNEKWVRSTGKAEKHGEKLIRIFGTFQDITPKKRAEEQLIESYKAFEDIRSALNVANIVSITDEKGIITYVNENFCKITKYEPREVLGKTHRILNSGFHSATFFKHLWETLNSGKVWKGEICNKTKDNQHYWTATTIVPFLDKNDKPFQFISIRSDITARKNAEKKLLDQYQELQKTNHELDKFVYSASHDLRAPVTSILGLLEIMRYEFPEPSIFMYVRMIEKSLRKTDQVLHEIMEYAQNARTEVQAEEVNLEVLVRGVIDTLRTLKEWYHIDFQLNITDKTIYTDKLRLRIILEHLISNAIVFHDLEKGNPYVLVSAQLLYNELIIKVEDNGIGIMPSEKDKIFEMFHRSSEKSRGAGLGLYIVKETLGKLNGSVSVLSEPNKGSIFICKFPIVA